MFYNNTTVYIYMYAITHVRQTKSNGCPLNQYIEADCKVTIIRMHEFP